MAKQENKTLKERVEELRRHSLDDIDYLNQRKSRETRYFVENIVKLIDIHGAISERQYIQDIYNEAQEYTERIKQIDEFLDTRYSLLDKIENLSEKVR